MIAAEYRKAYLEARNLANKITLQTQRELLKVFKEAADLAAEQVKITDADGLSDLTSMSWRQIENQLKAGADLISNAVEELTPKAISEAYGNYLSVDVDYIGDTIKASGTSAITKTGVKNIGAGVNLQLLAVQANRVFQDGYTFSERIWKLFDPDSGLPIGVNGDYQYRIKNIILSGQAQGRDNIKIAQDIQTYVAKGKQAVFTEGRYGKLLPGTREYYRRISRTVDWRALRIVRSEMHASLQQAGVLEGTVNPAATKMYNWVKQSGNPIDVSGANTATGLRCIDLEAASPYKLQDVPSYNHPHCSCSVIPILMDQRDFVKELKNFTIGDGSRLDQWYQTIYKTANP